MPDERLLRVLIDHLEEPAAVAAGGDGDAHARSAHARQPLLQDGLVGGPGGNEDTWRDLVPLHVELAEKARDQAGRVDVLDLVHDPAAPAHHPAAADEEHLERRFQVVLLHPDDVEVVATAQHHLLALHGLPRRGQLVPELRGALELERLRRAAHLGVQAGQDGPVVAGQENEALALQPVSNQVEESGGRIERLSSRSEQEVEHVAEEDHFIDVEVGLQ